MVDRRRARISLLGAALIIGLVMPGAARTAQASQAFPSALQKALNKQFPGESFCVPLCTACHLTTKGGPGEINVFGQNLEVLTVNGKQMLNLKSGNDNAEQKVDDAITRYFAATPDPGVPQVSTKFIDGMTGPFFDSDRDGISDYTELQNFDSPSLKLPRGEKEFCSDITYGCFARVAAAPPPADRLGLFSAGLVVLGLAARRRSKRVLQQQASALIVRQIAAFWTVTQASCRVSLEECAIVTRVKPPLGSQKL